MDAERIEALRMEVARIHGVLLDPKDPLFAVVTLNRLVLDEYLALADAAAAKNERQGAALMAQQVAEVKGTAERMIASAARYIANEVKTAGDAAQARITSAFDDRIRATEALVATAIAARRTTMVAAAVAVAASLLTLGVVIGASV